MQTTFSSREFNQDVAKAKRAARKGPVIITDRGKPAYVLLKHEDYRRLRPSKSIADLLNQDEPEADFDFDPPKLGSMGFKIPNFED